MVVYEKYIHYSNHDDCNFLEQHPSGNGGTGNRSCGCHGQGTVSTEDGRLQFMDDNERFIEGSGHRIHDGRPACSQTSQRTDSHSVGILWQDCCHTVRYQMKKGSSAWTNGTITLNNALTESMARNISSKQSSPVQTSES